MHVQGVAPFGSEAPFAVKLPLIYSRGDHSMDYTVTFDLIDRCGAGRRNVQRAPFSVCMRCVALICVALLYFPLRLRRIRLRRRTHSGERRLSCIRRKCCSRPSRCASSASSCRQAREYPVSTPRVPITLRFEVIVSSSTLCHPL